MKRRRRGLHDTQRDTADAPLFDFFHDKIAEPETPPKYRAASPEHTKTGASARKTTHKPPASKPSPKPLTVSELTGRIRGAIEVEFPSSVLVQGEISNLRRAASGHLYFSLKDSAAQIDAVMWKSAAARMRFTPEDGMAAICSGTIGTYPPRSSYQMIVTRITPEGAGALQLAFEQLKIKLQTEGLFDPSRKKPLPAFPERIGVITSAAGAALRDILNITWRRWPAMHVILCPTLVQGETAARTIADAITLFNRYQAVDVLIVGRGGGSMEDLWAFNEEPVVRAIAGSAIPIISAVGHETDTTLSDFAADLRAPTPSAAAELAVPDRDAVAAWLVESNRRISGTISASIDRLRNTLRAHQRSYAFKHPRERLQIARRRLDDMTPQLNAAITRALTHARRTVTHAAARLESLSPLAVLGRGYSLTRDAETGAIIRNSHAVSAGQRLHTQLANGEIISRVTRIVPPPETPADPENT